MKMNNTQINTQLELDFAGNVPRRPVERRRRRLPNAGWWFNQIRALIDSPQDVPAVRPVQCRLALLPTR
tara:strand:+ start:287 stop:493 length:207 start_codon:yes stop_codon:yes gene_type:complete